jgi:glycosyltransferase involved in cell wall biosynthesis
MRVAFLSPSWPPEGAPNGIVSYVDRILPSLRGLGHRPCVISACSSGDGLGPDVYPLEQEERPPLSRLIDKVSYRLGPDAAVRRKYAENLLAATNRAIAERGVELLEIEDTFGLAQLIRPRLPIPVVVRLHGPYFANAPPSGIAMDAAFHRRVRHEGRGIAAADGVSSVSKELLERTRAQYGLPLDGAAVIPAPAPIVPIDQRWRQADCDPSRILFVGRFDLHKGGDVVADAWPIVARRFPDVRLWFVGAENGRICHQGKHWSLAEYVAERTPGVAERIDRLGRQPQAALDELRRRADLTIVASRYETFGLVALEAMAYGCPLVATRTGGIAETVADGINGLLCEPGNAEDMAAKIIRLLEDPNLAARLGHRAAEDACGRYHPDTIARETACFHQRVLDARGAQAVHG